MKNEYLGRWRIVEMEKWDQDFVDMVVPGYILFEENDSGEFQFGAVFGSMECRTEPSGDSERLEFSWDAEDEMDEVGRESMQMDNSKGGSISTTAMIQGLQPKEIHD